MNLLVWTLAVPLVTAAIGGLAGPRRFKETVMIGGRRLTFVLCLATARQFLGGAIPAAFGDALRVDGLSALVLVLCGFVGLLSGTYGVGYLRRNEAREAGHPAHAPRVLRPDPRLRVRHAPGRRCRTISASCGSPSS